MFTKIVTITPTYSGRGATDTFAVIYRGKADNGDAFNMVISEYCLREAKLVIGDGVDLSLVHDTKGKKWIMIDANVNGYRLEQWQRAFRGGKREIPKGNFQDIYH